MSWIRRTATCTSMGILTKITYWRKTAVRQHKAQPTAAQPNQHMDTTELMEVELRAKRNSPETRTVSLGPEKNAAMRL